MPRVHMLSLSAIGTPASGPGSSPRATAASTASARGARLVGEHEVERVDLGLARVDRARGAPRARRAPAPPGAHVGGDRERESAHGCLAEDARHPEAPVLGLRRRGQHFVAVGSPGRASSARNTFTSGSGCAVGGTPSVSSADTCAACSRIAPSSLVSASISSLGQREPGELRDVLDLGAGDAVSAIGADATCTGSSWLSGSSHHSAGRRRSTRDRDRCSRPGTPAGTCRTRCTARGRSRRRRRG